MLEATARLVATQTDADATGTPEPDPMDNAEMDVPALTHPEWQNDIRIIANTGNDNPLLVRDSLIFIIRIENDMAHICPTNWTPNL